MESLDCDAARVKELEDDKKSTQSQPDKIEALQQMERQHRDQMFELGLSATDWASALQPHSLSFVLVVMMRSKELKTLKSYCRADSQIISLPQTLQRGCDRKRLRFWWLL